MTWIKHQSHFHSHHGRFKRVYQTPFLHWYNQFSCQIQWHFLMEGLLIDFQIPKPDFLWKTFPEETKISFLILFNRDVAVFLRTPGDDRPKIDPLQVINLPSKMRWFDFLPVLWCGSPRQRNNGLCVMANRSLIESDPFSRWRGGGRPPGTIIDLLYHEDIKWPIECDEPVWARRAGHRFSSFLRLNLVHNPLSATWGTVWFGCTK